MRVQLLGWIALLGLGASARAAEPVDYLKQVKPLLKARCYACHGPLKQSSGLRLDAVSLALKGGGSGPALRPGNASASAMIRRISATDPGERMPPEGDPLKPDEIALLRAWIDQNAKAPADDKPEPDPRDHWAFKPVRRPPVPKVKMSAWVRNPIDAFLAQRYEQKGLKPQPEAPRLVLIRRLYQDLLGLPPSPEDLTRLDADRAPGWYERLADRLLADPRYGERWGRQWMDVWRYSDWWGLGDQLRNSQQHIWHWRDWIIESMNADTPYDEMVREMLAADELYPGDLNRLRATGYLARTYNLYNRTQWLEDTVEHVSKGFLGLTLNCAKCHDHKYDPFQQADFYRMRAFFEPYEVRMDVLPGQPNLVKDGLPRVFDSHLDTPTYLFIRGQETRPDKSKPLAPGVPAVLAFETLTPRPVSLPKEAWQPERRPWILEGELERARKGLAAAQATRDALPSGADAHAVELSDAGLEVARAEVSRIARVGSAMRAGWAVADAGAGHPELELAEQNLRAAAVRAERELAAARARLALGQAEERLRAAPADQKTTAEKLTADARTVLDKAVKLLATPIGAAERYVPLVGAQWSATRFAFSGNDDPAAPSGPQSSGRRTALAQWITDRRNPLTPRVAVNQIWMRHMGVPLVPTVFDFGRKGAPPTHPELLDWLASELMDHGWSMKHLHRLIVTSTAYRMSSSQRGAEANIARDPDNIQFWRRVPIRIESESVRDSILALAGHLDPTIGGPPVPAAEQAASRRRSLYFFHSDIEQNMFLETFDGAAVRECYRRDQSIIPQQALALTNSALTLDSAGAIAERLGVGLPAGDDAFIRRAFNVMLGMEPSPAEMGASRRALAAWRAQNPAPDSARGHLIWALLNHNDFVTLR